MICKCCKNEYHDSFVSCPFCGTATALNTSGEVESCPKCGACVIKNQPMCQFCGFENPARTLADNAKADNNGASFSGDYYNNQQGFPSQNNPNTFPQYPQYQGGSYDHKNTDENKNSKSPRTLVIIGCILMMISPILGFAVIIAASVKAKINKS